jgi:hypothetical protein
MVVTVSTAHDSFCSSIGNLASDDGSSRNFTIISNHSDDVSSSDSRSAHESTQMAMSPVQEGLNDGSSVETPLDDAADGANAKIDVTRLRRSVSVDEKDKTGSKKQEMESAGEVLVIPLSSRWRRADASPIPWSPVKRSSSKYENTQASIPNHLSPQSIDRILDQCTHKDEEKQAIPLSSRWRRADSSPIPWSPIKRSSSKYENTQASIPNNLSPQSIDRILDQCTHHDVEKQAKPIRRYASLSSAKKGEAMSAVKQIEKIERPLDLTADRRSRSDSDHTKPLLKIMHSVQRHRSAGDRPFQFLQRITGKSKTTQCDADTRAAMAEHACETDKMMDSVAGSVPVPTDLVSFAQQKAPIRSVPKKSCPRPTSERCRSHIESSDLLEMARCVSPSKGPSTRPRSVSFEETPSPKPEQTFKEVQVHPNPNSHRPASRHLKKQRSKSLLCSSDLAAFQAEYPELCSSSLLDTTGRNAARTHSSPAFQPGEYPRDISMRPPKFTRRSVSMDYTPADSPPRRPPRRNRSSSIQERPVLNSSFTDSTAIEKKDEDWQIVGLDEESTVASYGKPSRPLSIQENEMILLALEQSLEEFRSSPPISPSSENTTHLASEGAGGTGKLWWVKGADQKWEPLPFPMQDETTEENDENEMLEMVMRSSLLETLKIVHLHLLSKTRG